MCGRCGEGRVGPVGEAGAGMDSEDEANEYEKKRAENIERHKKILESLGIESLKEEPKKKRVKKRAAPEEAEDVEQRRSRRLLKEELTAAGDVTGCQHEQPCAGPLAAYKLRLGCCKASGWRPGCGCARCAAAREERRGLWAHQA